MRIAVVADIHGNAAALEAVCGDIARRNVARIVNLGDCVSGPLWPRETIETLLATRWPTVRGNHDPWVGEDPVASLGLCDGYAYRALDAAQRAWLRDLPSQLDLAVQAASRFVDWFVARKKRRGNASQRWRRAADEAQAPPTSSC